MRANRRTILVLLSSFALLGVAPPRADANDDMKRNARLLARLYNAEATIVAQYNRNVKVVNAELAKVERWLTLTWPAGTRNAILAYRAYLVDLLGGMAARKEAALARIDVTIIALGGSPRH